MSTNISRQYGLHEIPGTEAEAPNMARQVSAGFEGQMRDYVGAIWVKLGELERQVVSLEEWREEMNYRLFNPSSRPLPLLAAADDGGEGKRRRSPSGVRAPPRASKPWLAEGVSKATWYRRHPKAVAP
jgi:hypothetical protein